MCNRKGLNEWVATISLFYSSTYPITLCDDGNVVFVCTAVKELILKFQLNINSHIWIVATILDGAGEQKPKKRKLD